MFGCNGVLLDGDGGRNREKLVGTVGVGGGALVVKQVLTSGDARALPGGQDVLG